MLGIPGWGTLAHFVMSTLYSPKSEVAVPLMWVVPDSRMVWPALSGSSLAEVPDESIIGSECWVNHGATMHGTQLADGAAVGLNACCDYNTRIGSGAILGNGSATRVGQVIPENCLAEGVPAQITRENLTDADRQVYFGVLPSAWTHYEGDRIEARIREKQYRQV